MSDRTPLYVRIPTPIAEGLDRAAFERKTSKQDLVTAALRRITIDQTDETLTVGHADFRANPPSEVLTPSGVAQLLQVEEAAVLSLAESGELPGRRVGGEWRFAREAVLRWLATQDR
jgi:excisionase family DNA binding protein